MKKLYYKMFAKYGAVLSAQLHKDQVRAIEKAFDMVERGRDPGRMPDVFTQTIFDLMMCDYYAGEDHGKE